MLPAQMSKSKTDKKAELIYVITGKETDSVNAQCDKLLDHLLAPEQRATGLFNPDTAGISASQVLDELRTLPFLTEKRVVLIRNADKFISLNRELLEKYFDKPCPTGILVMTVNSWRANTRLAKKLSKVGKLLSITPPKPWQLPGRLSQYARDAYDKNLAPGAAEILIELAGDNLTLLYGEIDKLALFADTEKTITLQHIESLIGRNRLFNAFAVIDACLEGNIAHAVDRLRNMFATDKSTEYTVVGAFAFHLRRMFNAKVLLEKGLNTSEVASKLRIWYNKEVLFKQLHKTTLKRLGSNLEQLARMDFEIKTGRTNAKAAVERMVLNLAADSAQ